MSVPVHGNQGPTERRKQTAVCFSVCCDALLAQIWATEASGVDVGRNANVSSGPVKGGKIHISAPSPKTPTLDMASAAAATASADVPDDAVTTSDEVPLPAQPLAARVLRNRRRNSPKSRGPQIP